MRHSSLFGSSLVLALAASLGACSDEPTVIGEPSPMSAGGDTGAGEPPAMDPGPAPAEMPEPGAETPAAQGGAGQGGSPADTPDEPAPGPDTPSQTDVDEPITPAVTFVTPRGPCALETRVGAFSIEKQVEFGVIQGAVADGVVPTAIPRLALKDGVCSLLERRTLACIPACVGAETCGEDGACIPYPRQVSVGDVTITGLTRETTMSPLMQGNGYFSPGADNPPYAVDSQIVLSAAGAGEHAPFQLFGLGSEPLAEPPSWNIEPGTDLSVSWPAPTSSVAASVLVELTIDQHGASPLSLSCEFPDTGSAVVPAAIVDRMIDSGVSGFPNGRITRRTADHVELDVGCVELTVGSPLAANVSVSGFTPCDQTADCPSGQQCNVLLQRCE